MSVVTKSQRGFYASRAFALLAAIFLVIFGAAVVLLGMAAFLSGVTQTPLTAAVISMELTDNQNLAIPIFATCLIARAFSTLLCRKPVYHALAQKLVEEHERTTGSQTPATKTPEPAAN